MKRSLYGSLVVLLLLLFCASVIYFEPLRVNDARIRFLLWRAGVHSRYMEVDGNRIHYFDAPSSVGGPGIPLLLIHGLGGRGEDWAGLLAPLAAQGFHVYAPDLLGYGRSPHPDVSYSISLQEKTVVDFMHALGVPRADIGGWSMGGWTALKLTVDHPEMVDRLIVYDAAGVYFPPTFDASLFTPRDAAGLKHLLRMLSPRPPRLPGFVQRAAIRNISRNAWVVHRSVSAMETGRDLLDFRLHSIRKPTLIVWGEDDRLIPLSVGETMHGEIPGSSLLVIAGCGHLAPLECTGPVLSATEKFLTAQRPIRGGEATVAGP